MRLRGSSLRAAIRWVARSGCLWLVYACSEGGGDQAGTEQNTGKAQIYSEQIKALEKAKNVEQTQQQAEVERRKKIEEQTQ